MRSKFIRNPGQSGAFAKGRLRVGQMNGTEKNYAQELELQKKAGTLLWYRFEGVKLRLADNTFYTPDFAVMNLDMILEFHEVKGHWQDDARVKIKVAAEMYPFKFFAMSPIPKKSGGGWKVEVF
jgi:hypothetical protein